MPRNYLLISGACLVLLFGCATRQKAETPPPASSSSQPAPSAKAEPAKAPARTDVRKVKSKDGKISGEIFGTPAAGSKFAQLEIGMSRTVVEKLIGGPDDGATHITGRQFQPFYVGGDTHRFEAFYKSEGQLTYSNATSWTPGPRARRSSGDVPETLIIISVDTKATGLSRR